MKNVQIGSIITILTFCGVNAQAQFNLPSDLKANKETRNLYNSMQRLMGSNIMFGQHDDTGYGVNWRLQNDSSAVKAVTGSYPAGIWLNRHTIVQQTLMIIL